MILHDAPSRTLRPLADETLLRLVESRQFVGLRDGERRHHPPDAPDPTACRQAFACCPATTLPPSATSPAAATARSRKSANIAPDLCRTIFSQVRQGRLQSARYLHKRLIPLIACLSKESPAALKYALGVLGLMSADTRLPIVPLDAAAQREVVRAFAAIADEELIDSVGA